ncbi:MAG: hypothetical protein ACOYOH_28225, partial [Paracraurococcus sp.]
IRQGSGWPPRDILVPWPQRLADAPWPEGAWTAYHHSILLMAEFVAVPPATAGDPPPWSTALRTADPWAAGAPTDAQVRDSDHFHALLALRAERDNPGPPALDITLRATIERGLDAEIDELFDLVDFRPPTLAEARVQAGNILRYFEGLLTFSAGSHRTTVRLATAAQRIAQFQAVYYKNVFKRARPSMVSPRLMPPLDPPGHPSYPSGHATEAWLIALVLEQVLPREVTVPLDRSGVAFPTGDRPLRRLAARIARNREMIGVHYPSDSEVGRRLAENSLGILLRCPSLGVPDPAGFDGDGILTGALGGMIAAARAEWA